MNQKRILDQHSAVLHLIAAKQLGQSAQCMAFKLLSIPTENTSHPSDPADFNRCLRLLNAVPELRERIPNMASVSAYWAAIAEHWDDIEATFLGEVGYDWSKGTSAPQAYQLMKTVLKDVQPRKDDTPVFSIQLPKKKARKNV
ncbi:hypothetical protein [Pseudoalteromonas caenipelagi]|uniref:hypothetical protein n=1 Tax=Pseudoalteromonas caenipelagi TaxID=2726988 RepID=UPI001C110136|nr:hypothetical protein [Pseudoalteromonas caenipelagi]